LAIIAEIIRTRFTNVGKQSQNEMKTEIFKISDYYPLCYDLAELNKQPHNKPVISNYSADELMSLASEKQLNDLQALTMLIKNAFEGHLCHLNGICIDQLGKHGTFIIGIETDNSCKEMTCEFMENIHQYTEGIECAWKKIASTLNKDQMPDFDSMLNFIIVNQLFRLPVSYLRNFESERFRRISSKQKEQLGLQYFLLQNLLRCFTKQTHIEVINEKYRKQFKDILNHVRAKQNVLMQLHVKLEYASDPSIRNQSELDEKYFEFINFSKRESGNWGDIFLKQNSDVAKELQCYIQIFTTLVRRLYKLISKNCREVHTQLDGGQKFPELNELFFKASIIYNEPAIHPGKYMLQYLSLILILAQVINTRRLKNLPLFFSDYSIFGLEQNAELKMDELRKCLAHLSQNLNVLEFSDRINYKAKYIKDDEITEIHRNYLKRHLEYLEQMIAEVVSGINSEMKKKDPLNISAI
jgi:hypothetical protein